MPEATLSLSAAAQAFDAVATQFDERFGTWASVAAQRDAVRQCLLDAFPRGARLLEIGGGTGEDARWLAEHGRETLLTDASPSMIERSREKLRPFGLPEPLVLDAEHLGSLRHEQFEPFDGAFSNFAALNCVPDLQPVARALAHLIRPGGRAVLVLFGTMCPGEWVTQATRGDWRAAGRRFARGEITARLGGREFLVRYHRQRQVQDLFAPCFRLRSRRGIGVFVPPSAAEPWITNHPRLLRVLTRLDRIMSRPLAVFGDHLLLEFERTTVVAPQAIR